MRYRSIVWRKGMDGTVKVASSLAALVALFALGWILFEVIAKGAGAFDLQFFTRLPTPPGVSGGGLASAMVGTFMITLVATLLGVPVGIFAGIYLAEFGLDSKFSVTVRFVSNIIMGTPSIIIGVFIYALIVARTGNFSGYAGGVALAIIMLPVVARTTEDMLYLVPNSLRESALALGSPRWKATLGVIFRAAKSGLLTGVLLAVARVSGETAPLLFTALNSPYWPSVSMNEPTANLTVTIFNYAMSPYSDWKSQAWGASLLIMIVVLGLAVFSRLLFKGKADK